MKALLILLLLSAPARAQVAFEQHPDRLSVDVTDAGRLFFHYTDPGTPHLVLSYDALARVGNLSSAAVLHVLAAGFDHRNISVHDHILSTREFFDRCAAGVMVPMSMADQ